MEKFINADFLLENEYARELYRNFAEKQPIIDFHCHLDPKEIWEDRKWENISQLWLESDHYKWRAMRSNGVDERYCTGDAPDFEKFQKYAETMPQMLGNPMYHWTHMELAKYFGIDDVLLSGDTAQQVWDRSGEVLANGFSARKCLSESGAKVICTIDDPTSDLQYHKKLAESDFGVKVLPTFRPDRAFAIDGHEKYIEYLEKLEQAAGMEIGSYEDLLNALKRRHDYFHKNGCRVSAYGLDTVWYKNAFYYEVEDTFKKAISSSEEIAPDEILAFKSAILLECAAMDYDKGWVRELYIGALRDSNTAMRKQLGAEAGFDSMGETNFAKPLAKHLDKLNMQGKLGKTILFNINPKDSEMLASMLGNFQDGKVAGALQSGSAWWFMNSIDGITRQLNSVESMSLLGRFIGTLSDARSFTSYSRHEYFRRILCNYLGTQMQRGLLPKDIQLVGAVVSAICYGNAQSYFLGM